MKKTAPSLTPTGVAENHTLQLFPDQPTFGLLCVGFQYRMTITVFNGGTQPERMKVSCHVPPKDQNRITCTYNPIRLAPGMSSTVLLKIKADEVGVPSCELRIVQGSKGLNFNRLIKGYIIPIPIYKSVTRTLKFENRPIYPECVRAIGQILPETGSSSLV